jgi:DNA-binding beta-propeller fold protein YncE
MIRRLIRIAPLAVVAAAASAVSSACAAQPAPAPYRVLRRTVLGGDGGWDYLRVDPANHRLFVSRGTHVMVVSLDADSVIGDIPGTIGVHGVALVPSVGRGFTSNGRDTSVTIFDLRTLQPVRTVKVTGRNPDSIIYDGASGRVFTFNGGSGNATALDARTGEVAGTVALAGRPEEAASDGAGHVWVNLEDKAEVEEFDARTLRSLGHWKLDGCDGPTGIAYDAANHRVFSACDNHHLAVTDARTGRTVASVEIGEGPDGAGYDPATHTVFTSNGAGSLTIIHQDAPDRYTVVQTLDTQRGARTMTLDPTTHRVYTVTAEFGPAPAPTPDNPRPRRPVLPGSFVLLTIGR